MSPSQKPKPNFSIDSIDCAPQLEADAGDDDDEERREDARAELEAEIACPSQRAHDASTRP